eukprot:TRINITY_DN4988_c0_g1_i12.p1 TRINITY_DN4988_c0_g1~~TRINITY_DN4988_c0_g1_i12.p1  ORF type:complete len:337 (-),score=35.20 TRINITY_DN4988_c0_g1_i12:368-1378(-)
MNSSNGSNIQETFFNLKTLTLRDRLPQNNGSSNHSNPSSVVTSSQQRIYTQSPSISSQTYLSQLRILLTNHWKWLAAFLIGASYIIFIIALYTSNNQLIQANTRLLQDQIRNSQPEPRIPPGSSLISSTKSSSGSYSKSDSNASLKKMLLSVSSQQSQINKLRKTLDETQKSLKSVEKKLANSEASNEAVLQAFIRESNISLCAAPSSDKSNTVKLIAPLSAIYRVKFSTRVHGNTYINRKMFQITKNTQVLRNGGVVRIQYNGRENLSVECGPSSEKTCFYMEEILLVNMKSGDTLQVEDLFSKDGGHVYDLRFCMSISDRSKIPGDEESLVVTH